MRVGAETQHLGVSFSQSRRFLELAIHFESGVCEEPDSTGLASCVKAVRGSREERSCVLGEVGGRHCLSVVDLSTPRKSWGMPRCSAAFTAWLFQHHSATFLQHVRGSVHQSTG